MSTHTEHETVDVYPADCWEGDCDHESDCPLEAFDVCLDCMEDAGHTRDPEHWADWEIGLIAWPHSVPEPTDSGPWRP